MKYVISGFVFLLVLSFNTMAQMPSGAPEEMQALSMLEGEWLGEGWIVLRDGKHEFIQHETVCPELDSALMLIEGIGRAKGDKERIVHHAFAVLSYHPFRKQYFMRSYLANGLHVDADITVDGQTITWQFEQPHAGIMRYNIDVKDAGHWIETGEMSRDGGKTWQQFFVMTLERQNKQVCQ